MKNTPQYVQWVQDHLKTFAQLFIMSVGVMNMTFLMIKPSPTAFDGFVFSLNLILVVGLLIPFKPINKGLFVAWAFGHCILIFVTKNQSVRTSGLSAETILDDLHVPSGLKNLIHVSIMAAIWIAVILVYSVAQLVSKTGSANETGNDSIVVVVSVSCEEVCCHERSSSSFPIDLLLKKLVFIIKKFHFREEEKMIDIINS